MTPLKPTAAPFAARVDFLCELAARLHSYGTTAQRLEGAMLGAATRLQVACEPWSNPTGMILSFRDPAAPGTLQDTTRVIRLSLGDTDLHKLSEADRIAEDVMNGRTDLVAGHAALRALDQPMGQGMRWMQVLGFGLVAAAVGCLLRLPWLDIGTAAVAGLGIGGLMDRATRHEPLRDAAEAIAGILAGLLAIAVATWVGPLNLNTVMIASLIVLLPGMAITNAVNELTSQHLVSGTSRLAGGLTTVLKLTIGTLIAVGIGDALGLDAQVRLARPQPLWVEGVGLAGAALGFAILFRAERRDYPVVMLAAAAGYLISRFAGAAWGNTVGVFVAALGMTVAGNLYARWCHRPGAIVRLPGIVMLVPGSISLRGFMALMQQDTSAGHAALMGLLNILLALIAGLIFGNLMAPARRNL